MHYLDENVELTLYLNVIEFPHHTNETIGTAVNINPKKRRRPISPYADIFMSLGRWFRRPVIRRINDITAAQRITQSHNN